MVSITDFSAFCDSYHSSSLLLNSVVCLYNANESRLSIPQEIPSIVASEYFVFWIWHSAGLGLLVQTPAVMSHGLPQLQTTIL